MVFYCFVFFGTTAQSDCSHNWNDWWDEDVEFYRVTHFVDRKVSCKVARGALLASVGFLRILYRVAVGMSWRGRSASLTRPSLNSTVSVSTRRFCPHTAGEPALYASALPTLAVLHSNWKYLNSKLKCENSRFHKQVARWPPKKHEFTKTASSKRWVCLFVYPNASCRLLAYEQFETDLQTSTLSEFVSDRGVCVWKNVGNARLSVFYCSHAIWWRKHSFSTKQTGTLNSR